MPVGGARIRLRFAGECRRCSADIWAGEWVVYFRDAKQVECVDCSAQTELAAEVSVGTAGASARREYERRVAKRATAVHAAHPRLGRYLLAITQEPQSTKAWAVGAKGEELLGARLDGLAKQGVRLLHDRRIPRTRANIDHLAVSSAGVFVIDAKRYQGRPRLRVQGGLLLPRTESLLVGRRDCTKLVDGARRQVDLVRQALSEAHLDDVPLRGMLCFLEADWPLIGGSFRTREIDVLWPEKAAELICMSGELAEERIATIHGQLAKAFAPQLPG
ncbi:MAG: hypothetical protein QOG80_2429 [Pseudonocardiales bacterium]|nr:hypothetical protein [Pseudonocardiales bacterium]